MTDNYSTRHLHLSDTYKVFTNKQHATLSKQRVSFSYCTKYCCLLPGVTNTTELLQRKASVKSFLG